MKDIRVEDESDDIPVDKKFLIEQHQTKFKDFWIYYKFYL
jgi:hypothetical protein